MIKQFFFKQFSISHSFALILIIKHFYLTHRVDLEVMTMKGFSAFFKASALLESYHQFV